MKRSLAFMLILIFVISFTGCKNYSQKEITKLIKDYKAIQYTVNDYTRLDFSESMLDLSEQCEPYFTEDGYKYFLGTRVVSNTIRIALKLKCNIQIEKIDLKLYKDDSKNGILVYDYNACLKLVSPETSKEKTITHYGQILLKKQDKTWKIDSDLPNELHIDNNFTL
jgi:hypothetical protein